MKLQVLVSTMNQVNYNLPNTMKITGNYVVINQICNNKKIQSQIDNRGNKFISVNEKGLSKSRNLAIKNSDADICIIADDDVIYYKDYEQVILKYYEIYKDADIIIFDGVSNSLSRGFSYIGKKPQRLGFLKTLKVSSVRISFKRNSIVSNNISFDERFGAGSGFYYCGEENIFLYDSLKKGLKIYYVPISIFNINFGESSWFSGINEQYMITKGAVFYRLSPKLYLLYNLQFAIRKRTLYRKYFSFFQCLKLLCKGSNKFKKDNML